MEMRRRNAKIDCVCLCNVVVFERADMHHAPRWGEEEEQQKQGSLQSPLQRGTLDG